MSGVETALNRLCKWRSVLAGWHLGTRGKNEPGVQAMRDLQDFRLIVRAEVTAIVNVLLAKGTFTKAEFEAAMTVEAVELEKMLQRQFPGYRATDEGMSINPVVAEETNKAMGFPL